MIDNGRERLPALALAAVVVVVCGCSKKEPLAPSPAPAASQTSAASKESQTQTDTATKAAEPTQGAAGFDSKEFLASLDQNKDGKITREEYGAIWKDKSVAERNFKMIDRNGDGLLTGDEFKPAGMPK